MTSLTAPSSRLVGFLASRRLVVLLLLMALIALRLSDPAPLEELRLRAFDLFQTIQPRNDQFRPVTIVDIDEASLSAYGQWPWPRTLIAELLNRLAALQSKAVAFDVVFPEPDRSSPNEVIKYFDELDEATRRRLSELPTNDQVFARAIGAGRVVLGQAGMRAVETRENGQLPDTGIATLGPDPSRYLITFPRLLRNLPELERAAAGRGLFTIATERDGIVRRVPLVMKADDKIVPALTVDLLRTAIGASTVLVRSDDSGVRTVAVPGLELPTDQNARVWVHFAPHDITKYVSAADILTGRAKADKFADKLVLIGTSAIGLLDLKTTPVYSAMPGVEIHAQILEAALTDSLLTAPSYAEVIELSAAACAGLILAVLAPMANALALLLIAALSIATILAASWTLFSSYRMLIDPTFPLIVTILIYVSLVLIGYFREQMDRRRIRSAFSQYLSPSLVEQLADSPHKLVLGGEERTMTVLFSDIRGFTSIAEILRNDPAGLTTLINRFLTPLTNAIISCNGTIDKYMGDAVMAFWNAPLDDPLHEIDACNAAMAMLDCVQALNSEREREARETGSVFLPIKIGIGINTGQCVVGNMGSELRFQYTVMGDSVNLASRLEGQTAFHGVSILIGSQTAQAVSEKFALLQADFIRVKGRLEPEIIYTIVGNKDVLTTDDFKSFQTQWDKLISRYRQRDWLGASTLLENCRVLWPKYGLTELASLYVERCQQFIRTPPPSDWDGVFVAETK